MSNSTNAGLVIVNSESDKINKSRNNINDYMEYVYDIKQAPIHRQWHDFIQANPWGMLLASQFHGKSTQVTLGIPTFGLGKNPNLRFGIIRQSDDMANSAVTAIKETISENERYHRVFPHVKRAKGKSWKQDRLTVKRDRTDESPSVHGIGVLSAPSGRKDWLIWDDPCTHVTSIQQPKAREAVINSWTPFKNLLGPKGWLTYICTPYHEADLTGTLRKHKAFKGHIFSKGINRNFDPIWEEVWPREELIEWHNKEINPREFWRAFGLETVSVDEQLITKETLLGLRIPYIPIPDAWPRFTGVDLATLGTVKYSSEVKRTAFFTLAMDPESKKKYPVDIRYGKYSSPDTAKELISIDQEHNLEKVYVESNNYQTALIEWIGTSTMPGAKELSLKIEPYFTHTEKMDPRIGLPGLAGECSSGKWSIPSDMQDHGDNCRCGTCQWIREFSGYPIHGFSDVLMASWFATRAANDHTHSPSFFVIGSKQSNRRPLHERLL